MKLKGIIEKIEKHEGLRLEQFEKYKGLISLKGYEYAVLEAVSNAVSIVHVCSDWDEMQDVASKIDEGYCRIVELEEYADDFIEKWSANPNQAEIDELEEELDTYQYYLESEVDEITIEVIKRQMAVAKDRIKELRK